MRASRTGQPHGEIDDGNLHLSSAHPTATFAVQQAVSLCAAVESVVTCSKLTKFVAQLADVTNEYLDITT